MSKVEEWAKSKNIKLIRLNSGGTRTQATTSTETLVFLMKKHNYDL